LLKKVIGSIHEQDLVLIQNAIFNSGLLTEEQIEMYFTGKLKNSTTM